MNKIELVIFDLDGVIVSTDQLHYQAWKKIADQENIPFDETINNRLRGVGRMDSLNIILEKSKRKYSEDEKIKLTELKNKYYLELLPKLSKDSILPNVIEVINYLKALSILVAIGSSSKNTKKILEYIGLSDYFDFISDGNNITRSKPYPDVFLNVNNNLHIDVKNTMVIEDACSGIDAANAGGMISVGIHDASHYNKCTIVLNDIKELIKLIEKNRKGEE